MKKRKQIMAEDVTDYITGKRHVVKAGGYANIVILEPPTEYDTLPRNKSDFLKLWIVNRMYFYVSGDNQSTWKQFWNSLEGLVTSFKNKHDIKYQDGHRYLRPVKRDDYHVFFSLKEISEQQLKTKYKELIIPHKVTIPLIPETIIPIPYPNIGQQEDQSFNYGYLKKGIKLIKIPLKNVQYQFSSNDMDYWIEVFFKNSQERKIKEFRAKQPNISGQTVISHIQRKAGPIKANKRFVNQMQYQYFPSSEEELNCFIKGWVVYSKMTQETTANNSTPESPAEALEAEFDIHTMLSTPTKPISDLTLFETNFNVFKQIFDSMMQSAFTPDMNNHSFQSQQSLLERITQAALEKLKREFASNLNIDKIKRFLKVFPSKKDIISCRTKDHATMEGIQSIAATYNTVITKSTRINATYSGQKPSFSSWKKVYFASGSDAFSEEEVPRHVFSQVLNWWKNIDDVRKDFIKDCSYIEVIGYSSKKGLRKVNKRLRSDRAWKTAKSLQLILKHEGTSLNLVPIEKSSDIDQNIAKIYCRDEALGYYPAESRRERTLSNEASGNISAKRNRPQGDDSLRDRCATIIFHKTMMQSNDEQRSNILYKSDASAMAFPVKRVSRLTTINNSAERKFAALIYVCPAYFNDENR